MNTDFIVELIHRIYAPTPKFFKTINKIALVFAFITGMPYVLTQLDIKLPPAIEILQSKFIAAASIGAIIVAKLTKKDDVPLVIEEDTKPELKPDPIEQPLEKTE